MRRRALTIIVLTLPMTFPILLNIPLFLFIIPTFILSSNFYTDHHQSNTSPNILHLSETQLSKDVLTSPFLYPAVTSTHDSSSKVVSVLIPTSKHLLHTSRTLSPQTLMLCVSTNTLFYCFTYCSPNSINIISFFDYLHCHRLQHPLTRKLKFSTSRISTFTIGNG